MSHTQTPAILLRNTPYGDFDLIVTFYSLEEGKVSTLAKAARKSRKRFGGALELFSLSRIVYGRGARKTGLPILGEVTVDRHFEAIRTSALKTAYASAWAELTHLWVEEGEANPELFSLLTSALALLDQGEVDGEELHILFQIRFLALAGLLPGLIRCGECQKPVSGMPLGRVRFDHKAGAVFCSSCGNTRAACQNLGLGTVKLLAWMSTGDMEKALRIRFSGPALHEAGNLLETFIPFHLGKRPKSYDFLKQIRSPG